MAGFKVFLHDFQKGVKEGRRYFFGKAKPFLNGACETGFGDGHKKGLGRSGVKKMNVDRTVIFMVTEPNA